MKYSNQHLFNCLGTSSTPVMKTPANSTQPPMPSITTTATAPSSTSTMLQTVSTGSSSSQMLTISTFTESLKTSAQNRLLELTSSTAGSSTSPTASSLTVSPRSTYNEALPSNDTLKGKGGKTSFLLFFHGSKNFTCMKLGFCCSFEISKLAWNEKLCLLYIHKLFVLLLPNTEV